MNILALFLALSSVIATHPATNPRARLLTVEESVGQSKQSVYPERVRLWWDSNSELTKTPAPRQRPHYILPKSSNPRIIYGQTTSRNEFGAASGVILSPIGDRMLVYCKDESAVRQFPLFDIDSLQNRLISYPMAGESSEQLKLCVCDLSGNILSELDVREFDSERYLTNPAWSPDGKYIFVQVLDRAQHNMHLNMYRASNGELVREILRESNPQWVEPRNPIRFLKGSYKFIYDTDNRTAYRNLFLCDTLGQLTLITPCKADVEYVANDGQWVYYTSAEVSPIENHLFRVNVSGRKPGKPKRLTSEEGWHSVDISPDFTKFIDRYSSFNVPGEVNVKDMEGKTLVHVLTATDPLDEYAQCQMELGSVRSADGKFDNYYRLYYPRDFDPSKKYPMIVYVYGGPHSQMVTNTWLGGVRMWEMLMAQKGYVVYVQDNRGTERRGAEFEKAINRQCGVVEMEDQMAGIKELLDRCPWIDKDRIGVHGWSYGGFMTLSLTTTYPNFFKVAVAGGPVIDWKWYEVMYGERYMDTPASNPEGFEKTSLLGKAANLTGRVLVCQGVEDDTVVWEHSLSFVQKAIEAEKRIDYFPYPHSAHNMAGRARVHLYDKITDYFETYL